MSKEQIGEGGAGNGVDVFGDTNVTISTLDLSNTKQVAMTVEQDQVVNFSKPIAVNGASQPFLSDMLMPQIPYNAPSTDIGETTIISEFLDAVASNWFGSTYPVAFISASDPNGLIASHTRVDFDPYNIYGASDSSSVFLIDSIKESYKTVIHSPTITIMDIQVNSLGQGFTYDCRVQVYYADGSLMMGIMEDPQTVFALNFDDPTKFVITIVSHIVDGSDILDNISIVPPNNDANEEHDIKVFSIFG